MQTEHHTFISPTTLSVRQTPSNARIDVILENRMNDTVIGEIVFDVPSEVFIRPAYSTSHAHFSNAPIHKESQLTHGARLPYQFELIHMYNRPREETITIKTKINNTVVDSKEIKLLLK